MLAGMVGSPVAILLFSSHLAIEVSSAAQERLTSTSLITAKAHRLMSPCNAFEHLIMLKWLGLILARLARIFCCSMNEWTPVHTDRSQQHPLNCLRMKRCIHFSHDSNYSSSQSSQSYLSPYPAACLNRFSLQLCRPDTCCASGFTCTKGNEW